MSNMVRLGLVALRMPKVKVATFAIFVNASWSFFPSNLFLPTTSLFFSFCLVLPLSTPYTPRSAIFDSLTAGSLDRLQPWKSPITLTLLLEV